MFLILGSLFQAYGQQYPVSITGIEDGTLQKDLRLDTAMAWVEAGRLIQRLRSRGYWLAQVDGIEVKEDSLYIKIYKGSHFDKIEMQWSEEPENPDSRLKPSTLSDPNEINHEIERVLSHLENHGHPFAVVQIDSANIHEERIRLKLSVDPGIEIRYDSIGVEPSNLLSPRFASRYFGLGQGQLYSERALNQISEKSKNLTFAQLKNVEVSYQLKKAQVQLDFEPIKSNTIDGILGMVPREDGGVEFNGEFNLKLTNLFRSAKALEFHWERLRPETQTLNASYVHPVLLGSPLDLRLAFDQLKQDTAFSNRSLVVGLDYYPMPRLKMNVNYENKLGNQLDEMSVESGDFTIDTYGLGITYQSLDSRINPTDGIKAEGLLGIGNKEIDGDNGAANRSTQYDIRSTFDIYKSLSRRSVFYINLQGGMLVNEYLYLNDLYRLGGLRSIRGFNEGEFFASQYAVGRAEWRFFIDEESYLVTFFDQGFLSYEILSGSYDDRASGLGIGMQMNTAGGIFQVLYGLGKRKGERFSFDSSKIHFGYTAIF